MRRLLILLSLALFCLGGFLVAHAQETVIGSGVYGTFKSSGGLTGWCSLVPAQANLTHCWPWDSTYTTSSTAQDPVGGSNATLTSVTLAGSGPSIHLNNSGVFNGTSSIGATSLAQGLTGTTWTLNIWTMITTNVTGNQRAMANCCPACGGPADGWEFEQPPYNGTGVIDLGNGTNDVSVAVGVAPTVSTWYMYTITYSNGAVTTYLNGSSNSSGTLTGGGSLGACSFNVAFGYNPSFSGGYFPGNLAGVAMWNTVLSGPQIATLHGL